MRPTIMMCPPDYYGIEYEINAWMSRERPSHHQRAIEQWQKLADVLAGCSVRIVRLEPVSGLPDLVFTANAALVYRETAILARFRHEVRQREVAQDEAFLAGSGFRVEQLPNGMFFEGAGDALFCGDTLFAGYRIRSDARAHQWVGERLGCRVIPLELVDPYHYHLDTCFCPLTVDCAIYYPAAFDEYGQRALQAQVPQLIPVSQTEARQFACNAVVVGQTVITNEGCPELHTALRQRGFTPIETPLDEFVKAGGSAKCLTLRLDGEEAASWKQSSVAL